MKAYVLLKIRSFCSKWNHRLYQTVWYTSLWAKLYVARICRISCISGTIIHYVYRYLSSILMKSKSATAIWFNLKIQSRYLFELTFLFIIIIFLSLVHIQYISKVWRSPATWSRGQLNFLDGLEKYF